MLTGNDEALIVSTHATHQNKASGATGAPHEGRSWLSRAIRVEWIGQMAASLCWIASVLSYGVSSAGDWLQLAAACSWLLANTASLVAAEDD
ncbi:MAG: hypothetical protein MK110_19445 [Fuerstiella sp.]|nr:hypothetical protein [Fuerstiella sp.]